MAGWSSKPNEHEQVEALLSPYLDGWTSEAERTLVERHLGSCANCAHKFATLKATVAAVRELPRVRAPRSYALPRSMARQPRPSVWLVPALRAATALATLLFIIAVGGDWFLLNATRQAAAPAPARIALESQALPAPTASLQKSAPPVLPQAFDSATQATPPAPEAGQVSPSTPVEPPVEQPLQSGGFGGGGSGQPPAATSAEPRVEQPSPSGGLGAGGQPPAAAPLAPVRPSAVQTSEVESTAPAALKLAAVTPTPTAPRATAVARSAASMPSPTVTIPPTTTAAPTLVARAPEPQAPAANQRRDETMLASRAVTNPLRVAEGALALLALALGVTAWVVDRRSR